MTPQLLQMVNGLDAAGFMLHPQRDHFFPSRFPPESVLPGFLYFLREVNRVHHYVSLITYEGAFCEAVLESWRGPKSTRDGDTRNRTHLSLARSWPEVEAWAK